MSDKDLYDHSRLKGVPPKLYKVGDVSRATGLSRQTIHNYTQAGLIHAAERTPTGHRLYGEDTFARLYRVKLYRIHHTMEEVKAKIDEEFGPGPVEEPGASDGHAG